MPASSPPLPPNPFRTLRRAVALIGIAGLAAALLGATSLAAMARAWTWVELGLAGELVVWAAGVVVVRPRGRPARVALAVIAAGLAYVGWALAPASPTARTDALVRTRYVDGAEHHPWFQGLREGDSIRLGAWLGLTADEAVAGRPALDAAYAEIDRDPLFQLDESQLIESWAIDREHYWLAVPPGPGPHPLVVFVHGFGGSFQFYPYILARPAVERGLAIAFPTHGLSAKRGAAAADSLSRLVDAVAREVPIDRDRVSLVGLSAGGPAVFAPSVHERLRCRSVVAISAVFPPLEGGPGLAATRVLIVHGTADVRTSVWGARDAHAQLRRAGVDVTLREDLGADHLAILTARDRWAPLVLDWIVAGNRR